MNSRKRRAVEDGGMGIELISGGEGFYQAPALLHRQILPHQSARNF
jgi:hypothetical protein